MSNGDKEKEYIVTKEQILNAVRHGLECDFAKTAIVDELMKNIDQEVEIVLEDDCDQVEDDPSGISAAYDLFGALTKAINALKGETNEP